MPLNAVMICNDSAFWASHCDRYKTC